jgi:peptidoglycan/LPS O-acetylase OafA/YrhL
MTVEEQSPYPEPRRGSEYRTIQALRFIAAFMVVMLHSSFYTSERLGGGLGIYSLGANGVRLFFVISGFVMIMSSERRIGDPHGWRMFAVKRIRRIVPLYWVLSLVKLVTLLLASGLVLHSTLDWSFIAKSLLFVPARNIDGEIRPLLGVGWTLNFEMFFYLLFTAALACRVRPVSFIAPILVGLSMLFVFRAPGWPVPLYFLSDPIVLDFLCGMMIAHWCLRYEALPAWSAWMLVAIGLAYLYLPVPRPDYRTLVGSLLTTVAASAAILGATSLEPRIGPQIPRITLFLGAASYSLYLVHPIFAPLSPAVLSRLHIIVPLLSIGASVVIALVAGVLCYRFVETPLTRLSGGTARRRAKASALGASL